MVLSRRIGESILIGDHVKVKVLATRSGGQVRLGIEAPQEVRVDREEVRKRSNDRQNNRR
jgi:carbon storage regulator